MNQFSFEDKYLKLKVTKSAILVRLILSIITFFCFALPLFGIIFNVIEGNGIKFAGVIALGVFSLMGFFMLRTTLWNSYGTEFFYFKDDEIEYIADYRLFRDGKRVINNKSISYSVKLVGYENENKGVLIISNGESEIESVVKMQINDIEQIILLLPKTN